ncbi:hypothetical protein D3C87_1839370 [compost metagenome]
MGVPRMQSLAVLRTLLAAAIDDAADAHSRRRLAAQHVVPLRGLVDDGVSRQDHEIHARVDDDGLEAIEGCADGC